MKKNIYAQELLEKILNDDEMRALEIILSEEYNEDEKIKQLLERCKSA